MKKFSEYTIEEITKYCKGMYLRGRYGNKQHEQWVINGLITNDGIGVTNKVSGSNSRWLFTKYISDETLREDRQAIEEHLDRIFNKKRIARINLLDI